MFWKNSWLIWWGSSLLPVLTAMALWQYLGTWCTVTYCWIIICIYLYIYIYILYIFIYIHTYSHTYIHTYIFIHRYITYILTYIYIYIYMLHKHYILYMSYIIWYTILCCIILYYIIPYYILYVYYIWTYFKSSFKKWLGPKCNLCSFRNQKTRVMSWPLNTNTNYYKYTSYEIGLMQMSCL